MAEADGIRLPVPPVRHLPRLSGGKNPQRTAPKRTAAQGARGASGNSLVCFYRVVLDLPYSVRSKGSK